MLSKFISVFLCIFITRTAASSEIVSMVNGNAIDIATRPYQVAINIDRRIFRFFSECRGGGVIISANYILTAAHLVNSTEYKYFVRVGNSECTKGDDLDIEKTINHPLFDNDTLKNDIAILKMSKEIQFTNTVQPIEMADVNFNTNFIFVEISGYGRTCVSDDCPLSNQLEKIELTTLSLDDCRTYNANIVPQSLCHIDPNKRITSCKGDSGGPVTLARSSETILLGIVSRGFECDPKNVSMSSSIPYYREWIRKETKV